MAPSELSFTAQVGDTAIFVIGTSFIFNGYRRTVRELDELLASLQFARDVVSEVESREFRADGQVDEVSIAAMLESVASHFDKRSASFDDTLIAHHIYADAAKEVRAFKTSGQAPTESSTQPVATESAQATNETRAGKATAVRLDGGERHAPEAVTGSCTGYFDNGLLVQDCRTYSGCARPGCPAHGVNATMRAESTDATGGSVTGGERPATTLTAEDLRQLSLSEEEYESENVARIRNAALEEFAVRCGEDRGRRYAALARSLKTSIPNADRGRPLPKSGPASPWIPAACDALDGLKPGVPTDEEVKLEAERLYLLSALNAGHCVGAAGHAEWHKLGPYILDQWLALARHVLEEKAKLQAESDSYKRAIGGGDPKQIVAWLQEKRAEVERLKKEREQLEVQLAGCGAAALGWSRGEQKAKPGDYGYSASYVDVVTLRERHEALAKASPMAKALDTALLESRSVNDRNNRLAGECQDLKSENTAAIATVNELRAKLEETEATNRSLFESIKRDLNPRIASLESELAAARAPWSDEQVESAIDAWTVHLAGDVLKPKLCPWNVGLIRAIEAAVKGAQKPTKHVACPTHGISDVDDPKGCHQEGSLCGAHKLVDGAAVCRNCPSVDVVTQATVKRIAEYLKKLGEHGAADSVREEFLSKEVA